MVIMMEQPVTFLCSDNRLFGVVHKSAQPGRQGVLIVVGGPQYRVGSHRQFILLARHLAENGIAVMRFDYRGMGDSEGEPMSFDAIDKDINAAIDAFVDLCPQVKDVVIWGLCDAASAALFYAHQDKRVKGLVLLNPWVFTDQGSARTYLKHYYVQRIFNKDLWRKIVKFEFDYRQSLASLVTMLRDACNKKSDRTVGETIPQSNTLTLPERMRECLRRFQHPVLLILSGRDLTADEFRELIKSDQEWRQLLAHQRITRYDLIDSDHTFATANWRDQVAAWTLNWVKGV